MTAPTTNGLGIPEHGSTLESAAAASAPEAPAPVSDEQADRIRRLEEQNQKLEAERDRMARDAYSHTAAPQAQAAEAPGAAPDPVSDPDGFRAWTQNLTRYTQQAQDQVRYEVDERQRRDQIWRDFKAEYPVEARSERLVQAAFIEETGNSGVIPTDETTISAMKEAVARRVRGYAEAVTGTPVDSSPAKEVDRTEGISSGGSAAAPSPAPKDGEEKVSDLVDALYANQPAGFF